MHEAGQITIEVADDGRRTDIDAIRQRGGRARHRASREQCRRHDVRTKSAALIFAPGFNRPRRRPATRACGAQHWTWCARTSRRSAAPSAFMSKAGRRRRFLDPASRWSTRHRAILISRQGGVGFSFAAGRRRHRAAGLHPALLSEQLHIPDPVQGRARPATGGDVSCRSPISPICLGLQATKLVEAASTIRHSPCASAVSSFGVVVPTRSADVQKSSSETARSAASSAHSARLFRPDDHRRRLVSS